MTDKEIRKIVRGVIIEEELISPNKNKDGRELINPKETDDKDKRIILPSEDDRGNNEIQEEGE